MNTNSGEDSSTTKRSFAVRKIIGAHIDEVSIRTFI